MKKNFVQAGYQMLMILSTVDGHYSASEGKVIVNYIMKNYMIDCDIDKENQILTSFTKDQLPEHFNKMMSEFKEDSTEEQRLDFIVYAYNLIKADGRIDIKEKEVFVKLCNFFEVEYEPLFEETDLSALLH